MSNVHNLFNLMKEKNITKAELSRNTGISTGNLSDWANGRCLPSAEKLELLADYLDCSVDYLLDRNKCFMISDSPERMFTKKFNEILNTRNITAYQVAKTTGISQGLMNEYKNGIKYPTIQNLVKIADALGYSVDYLLGRKASYTPIKYGNNIH